MNEVTGGIGSGHNQRRFRHHSLTGAVKHGASINFHPLPAMRMRDDPAGGAAHHLRPDGFDLNPKPRVVALDTDHVKPRQAQQKVAALAVTAGRTAAGSRIGHRRGPRNQVVW